MRPLFHIVLHEPEIPNNTGNIGRTCVATGCSLHLVKPLGFDTGEHALRRAGLDYWPRLAPREHENWRAFLGAWAEISDAARPMPADRPPRLWLYSTSFRTPHWDADFRPGDAMVFGRETAGLPRDILTSGVGEVVGVPMVAGERSLNVATVACAAIAEGMRQCVARGEARLDASNRLDLS